MKDKIKTDKNIRDIIFTIFSVLVILIFCFSLTPISFQNDTFYTIKIGEYITQNGIDMQDPFSWHEDLAYTYPHWLYDLLTYFIYSFFGMQGIYITTVILTCILGLTLFFTNKKISKNTIIAFLITIVVMYLIRGYITARAQLVTFILFVISVYFIEKFLETTKRRYVLGLIIIPIMLANLHLAVFPFYFILYLPYIAEYLIALLAEIIIYKKVDVLLLKFKISNLSKKGNNVEAIERVKSKLKELQNKIDRIKVKRSKELQNPYKIRLKKNNNVRWLIVIMIICLFTGFLTPLGTTPYTYLYKTMQGNTTENINEHLPMTLANESEVLSVLVVFLAIMIFTKTKIRLADLFMIAGLCYLMLVTKRQVTMFLLIGSFIFSRLFMELIQIYNIDILKKALNTKTGNAVLILMMVLIIYSGVGFIKDREEEEYVDASSYPVAACDNILEYIDLTKAKFYNEYNYGSYMLFRGIPVFIDSRADLYAPEFSGKEDDIFMDFIETSSIAKFYEDVFEKYGITHIITYENSKTNMIIEKTNYPGYTQLYKDNKFVIYERTVNN